MCRIANYCNEDSTITYPRGVGVRLCFADLCQEQNAVDPQVRQQIEAVLVKFEEAYNKYDAAAMAALHTQDAVEVRAWVSAGELASGRQAIEKRFAADFASSPPKMVNELVQVYAIGNDMRDNGYDCRSMEGPRINDLCS
jgi:hypothetical protein